MYCLKCGKDTQDVFCDECKQIMENYPVKPDTPAILPDRNAYFAQKKASKPKRKATAEEQLVSLRKLFKFVLFLWGLTAAALVVFVLLWLFF